MGLVCAWLMLSPGVACLRSWRGAYTLTVWIEVNGTRLANYGRQQSGNGRNGIRVECFVEGNERVEYTLCYSIEAATFTSDLEVVGVTTGFA